MAADAAAFVRQFRDSAPYISAHRGRTVVVRVAGEALADMDAAATLLQDLALVHSLGIRTVVVAGVRPRVEARLQQQGVASRYHQGLRVTDGTALACVKEVVGALRVELEALLSMGLANSPMAGLRLRVASGNHVIARPVGVRDGVDFLYTGEVRRVDAAAMDDALAAGALVLLAPLGYSPTGEAFNVSADDVALAAATGLGADKLLILDPGAPVRESDGTLVPELDLHGAAVARDRLCEDAGGAAGVRHLDLARHACRHGVRRVHLLDPREDGVLLRELFTRDGAGTLIAGDPFEILRRATVDDVGGILELIAPLEREGVLVRRSREELETRIDEYLVVERDGMIIATAALSPHHRDGMAELACFVIHPDYRGRDRGDALLRRIERRAREQRVEALFVLTTRTAHWFRERGFEPARLSDLPVDRQALYNLRRGSQVFIKPLAGS